MSSSALGEAPERCSTYEDFSMDSQHAFHIGLLRQIAKQIGWDKLKALVAELAAEERS